MGKQVSHQILLAIAKFIYSIIKDNKDHIIKFTKNQFNEVSLKFHGKRIALIGPGFSGKTTFYHILVNPDYEVKDGLLARIQAAVKLKSVNIKFKLPVKGEDRNKLIRFKLRKPYDVGGESSYRDSGEWLEVCENADYLFYIFDSFEVSFNSKMMKRVLDDMEWIAENNQNLKQNFEIIIFANKIDKFIDENEKEKWINSKFDKLIKSICNKLGAFENQLKVVAPLSLKSKVNRINSISEALLEVTKRNE